VSTIGHPIVGLAIARRVGANVPHISRARLAIGLMLLATLPDIDLAFRLWPALDEALGGHRGATHSLLFALFVGALVGAIIGGARSFRMAAAVVAAGTIASHAALDLLTPGQGVAIFWPLAAPVTPWPVLPLARTEIDGLRDLVPLVLELIVFAPVLVYALWPRQPGDPAPDVERSRTRA
jgi:inner membrane protein